MRIALFLFLFVSLFTNLIHAQKVIIKVVVKDIAHKGGNLNIGVFNTEPAFQSKQEPFAGASIAVADTSKIKTTFELPFGIYAIAVYHDENSNNQLNKKKLGIPEEGVGFSGTLKSKFRPPKFEECSFHLTNDTTISISLKYPGD
jgi:uncharacterized protein (DUF2141 family)